MPRIGEASYQQLGSGITGLLSLKDSRLTLPGRANNMFDLDTHEVDKLLERVGLDNSFLRLATADIELIRRMKQTIEHQTLVGDKRERLLFAITTNVQYLSQIHRNNAKDLRKMK